MPKTLLEKIVFTLVMAAIMVYGMIVYNVALATGKATEAISRQPEASGKIQTNLLLGAALAEGTAIFGFVVALLIILFLG